MKLPLSPQQSVSSVFLAGALTLLSCKAHEQPSAIRSDARQQLIVTFRDVPLSHPNSTAVEYLDAHHVMGGSA